MKYFTKDMWLRLQNDKDKNINSEWKRAINSYQRAFSKLKRYLSSRTFSYYKSHDSHGHYILDIKINYKGHLTKQNNEVHYFGNKNKIDIEIKSLCPSKAIYLIKYHNVIQYTFDYPSAKPLGFEGKNGYDSIGYEEILRKSGTLINNILLHSGASFSIRCKSIVVNKLSFTYK